MGLAEKNEENSSKQDIYDALAGIGLNDAEIRVYRASLSLGTRAASIIADKSGLKRSHTYNILASLRKKGIVSEVIKNGVRHFSACSPTGLVGVIENDIGELELKKRNLENVLPALQDIIGGLTSQPKVRFYQGRQGIKEILEDVLRSDITELKSFTDFRYSWSTSDKDMKYWVESFISRREEKNIWWKSILVRSDYSTKELEKRSKYKREVKAIDIEELPAEFICYGTKVALVSMNKELMGIVIESEQIVSTFQALFSFLWSTLPDYEP